MGSAPAPGSCQVPAQTLPAMCTAAPCQHSALGQRPGSSPVLTPTHTFQRRHHCPGKGHWEQPSPHSARMLTGQSHRGKMQRGEERRGGLIKQLQITPAFCTFPGIDNNSTYDPSCLRAPPGCLQRAGFSGRMELGVANNYV